jgi:hypothetical protein
MPTKQNSKLRNTQHEDNQLTVRSLAMSKPKKCDDPQPRDGG